MYQFFCAEMAFISNSWAGPSQASHAKKTHILIHMYIRLSNFDVTCMYAGIYAIQNKVFDYASKWIARWQNEHNPRPFGILFENSFTRS